MKSHYAVIFIVLLAACKKDKTIDTSADTVKQDYIICAQDSWVTEPDFQSSYLNVFFVYNNKVYVPQTGSFGDLGNRKVHMFDGTTWTEKDGSANFVTYSNVAFFTIGSKGYAIAAGGWFYEYNILTNIWTRKADFPGVANYAAYFFVLGGKCYVAGGGDQNGAFTAETWAYNPATNTWTQRHNLPLKRADGIGFSVDGKGYIVNGTYPDNLGFLRGVTEYDPATDRWTNKSLMPGVGRTRAAAFVINGEVYIGGGLNEDYQSLTDFYQYMPSADTWTRVADIPAGYYLNGMFTLNNKGYVIYRQGYYPNVPSGLKKYNPKYCVTVNNAAPVSNEQ